MGDQIKCLQCGALQDNMAYCEDCGESFTGYSAQTKAKDSRHFTQFLKGIIGKIIFITILAVILLIIFSSPEWIPNIMDYTFDSIFETFGVEF